MSEPTPVYDLGEIEEKATRARAAAAALDQAVKSASGRGSRRGRLRMTGRSVASTIQTSAAVIVPGGGHLLRGEAGEGLFYLSWTGCLLALAGALWGGRDRFVPAVELLGWPREVGFWVILATLAGAASLHVVSLAALASRIRKESGSENVPAPVAAVLSAVVPGWGQAVHGRPVRTGVFLGGLWLMAGVALVRSSGFRSVLVEHGLVLPSWLDSPGLPWLGGGVLAALWLLSVYDALASLLYASRRG